MQVNRLPKSKGGSAGDQEGSAAPAAAAAGSPRKQVAIVPPEPRWIADNEECCGEGAERPQRHLKMNKGQEGEGGEERV